MGKRHNMGSELCNSARILGGLNSCILICIAPAADFALVVLNIALMCAGRLDRRDFKQVLPQHMAWARRLYCERNCIALSNASYDIVALVVHHAAYAHVFLSIEYGECCSLAKLCTVKLRKKRRQCADLVDFGYL